MKEAQVQDPVVRYARDRGVLAIKLSTMGFRGTAGWPDYLFLYKGRVMFIEFKRPGGKTSPLQDKKIKELVMQGFWVEVIDNPTEGKQRITQFTDFRLEALERR